MNKKSKHTLTPKLRFPEFRGEPRWEVKELVDIVTSISNGISLTQGAATSCVKVTRIETISESRIDLSKVGYIETGEDISAHKLAVGDILLSNINSIDHIGKSVIIDRDYDLYHGMNLLRLVIDSQRVVPRFAFLSLNTEEARASIRARANKAVNQASINQTELGRTLVVVPHFAEQHKIADCLSSLDELIAAEGRSLEVLRDHKRGLMQQLFPQSGETQPRLRFPEFRDKGEWEEKEVGEVFKLTRGEVLAMPLVKDERTEDAPYPVYSSQTKNVGLAGYYSEYLYEEAITWTTDGANAGDVNYRPGKFFCTNVCGVLISDKGFANPCTAALINSVSRQHVSYVGNPKLMNGVMAKIRIAFPPPAEQKRIADCLTALDAQITAQAGKIDALKTHKRGMMQQLFPAPEEIEA